MKIKIVNILYSIFVLSFIIYVLSSTYFLKENVAWLYFARHISVIFLAVIGVLLFNIIIRKTQLYYICIFLPIFLPFFRNEIGAIVFFQYLFFIVSAIVLGKMWQKEIPLKLILIMMSISILPIIIDYFINDAGFIYNNYYGRYRLLLGYFHPKEAGISVLIPIILLRLWMNYKNININKKILFDMVVLVLLYFIQSRNILLFYINFIIFAFLIRRYRLTFSVTIIAFIFIVLSLFIVSPYYDEVDKLMSNRLSVWDTGKVDFFGQGTSINSFEESGSLSKFHIDNFYLEYLIENGFFSFIVIFSILLFLVFKIGNGKIYGTPTNSLFISFLIFSFFDAGMFSTGNFLNLFIWSLIFATLYKKSNQKASICNKNMYRENRCWSS